MSLRWSLAGLTLVLAAGFALPAASSTKISYLGLRGSYVESESGATHGSGDFDYDESYSGGFAAAAYAGWVLDGRFRLELESGYRSSSLDEVTIIRDDGGPYAAGDVVAVSGDANVGTLMISLFYDIHIDGMNVLPWIGVGVGAALVDYSLSDPAGLFTSSDNAWTPAWQLMAGITVPLAEGLSLSANYRFFQTSSFAYATMAGDRQETELGQHSIDLGVQVHL